MENKTTVTGVGVIGLIAGILMAFGGTAYLTPDQYSHAYVCSSTNALGIFDNLSSTSKTGYYFNETLEVTKSSVCKNGVWEPLKQYASARGISPEQFLLNNQPVETVVVVNGSTSGYASVCGVEGCFQCQVPLSRTSQCEGTRNTPPEIMIP